MHRTTRLIALLLLPLSASAADMQLFQQGRLLDSAGGGVEGTHDLTVRIVDGTDSARFEEEFPSYLLQDGYFSVHLGASGTPLDTSVFLEHGAMMIEVAVDGAALSRFPAGGYPFVVAQQSLLARETTAQQVLSSVDGVSSGLDTATSDIGVLSSDVGTLSSDLDDVAATVDSTSQTLGALATAVGGMEASCGEGPAYSQTCADWSASGWSSLEACRMDGRWHRYATTTGTWDNPQGWLDFHAASVEGADTKLRIGREWYRVSTRSTDNPASGVYLFLTEAGAHHVSFRLHADGHMDSLHATTGTGNGSWNDAWGSNDLGNWHYLTNGYSQRLSSTNINEAQWGGIEVWASY